MKPNTSQAHRYTGRNAKNGFEYAAVLRPATDRADHFVDCCAVSPNEVALSVGGSEYAYEQDSSLVLCIRRFLHSRLAVSAARPAAIADELNEMVYQCCGENCLLNCFFARYQAATRTLCYVNAGHASPLLVRTRSNEIFPLERGGPVWGLQRAPEYQEAQMQLHPGDCLLAFSPSVLDSFIGTSQRNVESTLVEFVRKCRNSSAVDLANFILSEAEDAAPHLAIDRSVIAAYVQSEPAACLEMQIPQTIAVG